MSTWIWRTSSGLSLTGQFQPSRSGSIGSVNSKCFLFTCDGPAHCRRRTLASLFLDSLGLTHGWQSALKSLTIEGDCAVALPSPFTIEHIQLDRRAGSLKYQLHRLNLLSRFLCRKCNIGIKIVLRIIQLSNPAGML